MNFRNFHATAFVGGVVLAMARSTCAQNVRQELDSLAHIKYPQGDYQVRLGESYDGNSAAQQVAKANLAEAMSSEIASAVQAAEGFPSDQASTMGRALRSTRIDSKWAHAEQIRIDDGLMRMDNGVWIAVAYLRLSDAKQTLVSEYETEAGPWRERMSLVLKAPPREFSPVWREGRLQHGQLLSKAISLVALMSKHNQGNTISLTAVMARDDAHPYAPYVADERLWSQVEKRRAEILRENSLQIDFSEVAEDGRRPISDAVSRGVGKLGIQSALSKPKDKCAKGFRLRISGSPECRDLGMGNMCSYQAGVQLADCSSGEVLLDGLIPEKPLQQAAARGDDAARKALFRSLSSDMFTRSLASTLGQVLPVDPVQ